MSTLPTLTYKIWTGAQGEYWTYRDMLRCEYNANVMAEYLSLATVTFEDVTRASVFSWIQFQALENLVKTVCDAAGTAYTPETAWAAGRSVSYVDFERVELALYTAYKAEGGLGERVPADVIVTVATLTLTADGWSSAYPYTQSFVVFGLGASTQGVLIQSTPMTVAEKIQMDDAQLAVSTVSDRRITITAYGRRPTVDLKIIIVCEVLSMQSNQSLSTGAWSGSGPYSQTLSVSGLKAGYPACVGPDQRAGQAAVEAFASGKIWVSSISDGTAVISAAGTKPASDIPVTVLWDDLTGGDE